MRKPLDRYETTGIWNIGTGHGLKGETMSISGHYEKLVDSVCDLSDPHTQLDVFNKLEKLMSLQAQQVASGSASEAERLTHEIVAIECQLDALTVIARNSDFREYHFGSPRDRILTYLKQEGMLPTLGRLAYECRFDNVYNTSVVLDELVAEGLVGTQNSLGGELVYHLNRPPEEDPE